MAITDRKYAEELDAKDSLAKYRNEFVITNPEICYLDGNSLGRLPKRTIAAINNFLTEEWGAQVVEGWGTWIDEAQKTGNLIGKAALGAAEGHPASVMDLSFSDQALTAEWLVKEAKNLSAGLHEVPTEIDKQVARLKLASMGGKIDVLTPAQELSLNSWEHGS